MIEKGERRGREDRKRKYYFFINCSKNFKTVINCILKTFHEKNIIKF